MQFKILINLSALFAHHGFLTVSSALFQIMGSLFTRFLADSETQLILDMDFFKHFFSYAEAYRCSLAFEPFHFLDECPLV